MKQTLQFRRSHRPGDEQVLNPETDLYEWKRESDLWRVNWKDHGFPFCGVYLISQRSGWPIKIGLSENVPKRLAGLQTACWNELVCSGYWLTENRAAAQKLERYSHDVIAERGGHLLGEWFDIRADKASEVVEHSAQVLGIEAATEIPNSERFASVWQFIRALRANASMDHYEMGMAELYEGDGRKTVYRMKRHTLT